MDTAASGSAFGDPDRASTGNEFKYKYCRLCGVELTCGVFIYGEEGRSLQLADKIRKTLSILILEEDTLPKKICTDCCTNLEEYSKFKDTVADAQITLKAIAQLPGLNPVNHSPVRPTAQRQYRTRSVARVGVSTSVRDGSRSKSTTNLLPGGINSTVSNPTIGLISPSSLARCATCGAGFGSRTALDAHTTAEHPMSNANPTEEEEAVELHIPSPAPSEEPRLVEEDHKLPTSAHISRLSQEVSVSDIGTSSTGQSEHSPSNAAPCSSTSVSTSSTTSPTEVSVSRKGRKGAKSTYHCIECNKTLTSQAGHYRHMMVTHKGRRFPCSLCENTYCSKASLQHHKQSFHAETETSTVQSPTASSSTSTPKVDQFKCPDCPKFFRTKKRWTEHKKTHTTIRSFECMACHKFFKTVKCLRNHMGYHDGSKTDTSMTYTCPTCDKQFTKSKYLDRHKDLHAEDKKLGCPFCPHIFNGYPNYVKHVKRKHSEKIGADGKMPKVLRIRKESADSNSINSEPGLAQGQQVDSQEQEPCSSSQATKLCPVLSNESVGVRTQAPSTSAVSSSISSAPYTGTVSANGIVVHSQQFQHHNHIWSDPNRTAHINQAQSDRAHLSQPQHYSILLQPSQSHQSIPMIQMDDVVDSVIQSALLSHPQHLDSTSQHQGHSHTSSMQPFNNGQQSHRTQNNLSTLSLNAPSIHHSNYQVLQQNEAKGSYVRQFDETPLELCVRNNGEDSATENDPDHDGNYNQLVDLTSAKIVDLSGVGLVMAAAASASNNSQSSTNTATNSMLYRQSSQQQQHMSTMSMVQLSMLPIDLTDQQQVSAGMDASGSMHMPLSLTASQSSNHNASPIMNNNLVDLRYTGSNRGTNQFQMQQHQQSQQQQDEHMMSTSTFLRELLDLSCSTSTTRNVTSGSASTPIDTYPQQQQHIQQQNHFQPQHSFQHQQQEQSQYQQSPQDQTNQIQQYELNLSSKSRGYSMGQYHGQNMTSSNHGHSQQQQNVYQQPQTMGHSHNHSNSHNSPGRNSTANASSTNNATTNQFHNIMYNDTLFM